jgi:hypothetical protein
VFKEFVSNNAFECFWGFHGSYWLEDKIL